MVQEQVCRKVQYTVMENVVEKCIKKVPYQVCKMVPYTVTCKVPVQVTETASWLLVLPVRVSVKTIGSVSCSVPLASVAATDSVAASLSTIVPVALAGEPTE